MDEYQESNHNDQSSWAAMQAGANRLLLIAVVALLGVAGVAFAYGLHQQSMVRQLTAQTATANVAMSQMQGQLNTLTAKLNEATAAQTSPQPPAATAPPPDAAISGAAADTSAQ